MDGWRERQTTEMMKSNRRWKSTPPFHICGVPTVCPSAAAAVFFPFYFVVAVGFLAAYGVAEDGTDLSRLKGPFVYRDPEIFQSQCEQKEVVMVTEALLESDPGPKCDGQTTASGKCLRDIKTKLDKLCSGRPSCTSGLKDLCNVTCDNVSMNITYMCVKVIDRDCQSSCGSDDTRTKLTAQEGYISSKVTAEGGCGRPGCPWLIQVLPGQAINITLLDFSGDDRRSSQKGSRGTANSDAGCVVIKERANPKEVQECLGRQRERFLYSTISNTVEIRLTPREAIFFVHYKATGCADVVAPRNSRMKRTGNQCEIDCPGTEQKWVLNCVGNKWTGIEDIGTCPGNFYVPDAGTNTPRSDSGSSSFTGILIAAVIAITVIIAVLVLTIGFVCLKKHQYETKAPEPPPLLYGAPCSEFEFCTEFTPGRMAVVPKTGTTTTRSTRTPHSSTELLRNNTYAADQQLELQPLHRPLPSIPTDGRCGTWRSNDPKRIIVQLHRTGSGTETVSFIPPYPTMMMRDGRLPPCNCGTLQNHPSQMSINRPPSHLYFTLDPEVQAEEPVGHAECYPAPEPNGGVENQTIPRAHQRAITAHASTGSAAHMNHASSQDMVPLNLTNRSKQQTTGNVMQTNPIATNKTPMCHIQSNPFPANPSVAAQ